MNGHLIVLRVGGGGGGVGGGGVGRGKGGVGGGCKVLQERRDSNNFICRAAKHLGLGYVVSHIHGSLCSYGDHINEYIGGPIGWVRRPFTLYDVI